MGAPATGPSIGCLDDAALATLRVRVLEELANAIRDHAEAEHIAGVVKMLDRVERRLDELADSETAIPSDGRVIHPYLGRRTP